MVAKGQLVERPVVIPAGSVCLDGIYLRGDGPGLLIASPLPRQGGCMANPVGNELAYAAAYSGRASLRLDYRGVGGSEGEVSQDPARAAADLREGLAFLLETTRCSTAALASYLSGAWPALIAARDDPRIDRLVIVAPVHEEVPEEVPAYGELDVPVLVVVGGVEPTLNVAEEAERVNTARNARLQVIPNATHTFREELVRLARLVPLFLGAGPRD